MSFLPSDSKARINMTTEDISGHAATKMAMWPVNSTKPRAAGGG
jgi:hypothetical protein